MFLLMGCFLGENVPGVVLENGRANVQATMQAWGFPARQPRCHTLYSQGQKHPPAAQMLPAQGLMSLSTGPCAYLACGHSRGDEFFVFPF